MSLQSYISIIIVLMLGWAGHWLYNRVRLVLRSRRPVVVHAGESGSERYQLHKQKLLSVPIDPPPGVSPEAAKRFRQLSPKVQNQVIAARKAQGLDG